ncbi:hypothetical protein QMK33_17250 [Hymenobacter sp. H14-R3]|uniref:hypothetical protein n=1 Tax=Hymenobacter sp. H14-R3 TaxID=3046308 RepID=UPI0024BACD9B|nr:hypothetical protein [Hymenobacter sp. H14-R3]MDJ0366901.1 hypothetical protein [Hymenobacter sp. H14-R3]
MFLLLGLGLSSCAPGVYAGASVGAPYPYYGPSYYGPRYYAPRPVIITPARPIYRGNYYGGGDRGYHGGGGRGYYGGGNRGGYGGGHYGGRRGR